MPRVSSSQNPRFKETVRLVESSRERRKTGRCVLEGEHLITVYCDRIGPPETLVVVEDALDDPRIAALVQRIPPSDVLVVSRRMFSNRIDRCNRPRPETKNSSLRSSLGRTRRATFDCNSFIRRSRSWRLVT